MVTVAAIIVIPSLTALLAYRLGLRRGIGMSSVTANRPPGQSSSAVGRNGCVDFHRAGEYTGQQACISGRVLRVFTSRTGNTFLDFCADYRNCSFTSIVFASDRPKFGDLNTLQGRDIELRGEVRLYHNQPEVVISDPNQIREAQ
jgi:hypothetical protein